MFWFWAIPLVLFIILIIAILYRVIRGYPWASEEDTQPPGRTTNEGSK